MALINLKIGVWPQKLTWSNKILWLFHDEFGYPAELINDEIQTYPIIVIPFEELIGNLPIISRYIHQGNGLLIACSSEITNNNDQEHEELKVLPVIFGEEHRETGHCNILKNGNPLLPFFPDRKLDFVRRKDFNINITFRKIHVFPPTKTIVEFETIRGDRYPILACGKTKEGGKFAVIAANDEILECEDSNWGPLLYLAALEWILMEKPFVRKWHWPNRKRMNIILTFDFEGLPKYSNMRKYWWWHRRFDRFLLALGLRRTHKFLTEKKIRSTWFILGRRTLDTPNLAKRLATSDLIELAGHGDVHIGIDKTARRFDKEDLHIQRKRLQVMRQTIRFITHIFVEGFRAPGLYANYRTLEALQESGFKWDCSASPQTDYPLRWFFLPYYPVVDWRTKRKLDIVEIPVTGPWDRWCPAHGSLHSPQEYQQEILEDFNFLHFIGGIQTLIIHPYQIALRSIRWKVIKSFIAKILQFPDIAFSTCGEVYSSWMLRSKMSVMAKYNYGTASIHIQVKNAEPDLSLLVRIPEGQRAIKVLSNDPRPVHFECWEDLHAIVFAVGIQGDGRYMIPLCKVIN